VYKRQGHIRVPEAAFDIAAAAIVAACAALVEPEPEPWKCVCGANLYIDANGAPRSRLSDMPEPEPVAYRIESDPVVRLHIGNQSFTLDYFPEDEPGETAAKQRAWMAARLSDAIRMTCPATQRRRPQYGEDGPLRWPKTPEEIRSFVGSDFCSMEFGRDDEQPCDHDTYTVTAHDLLSAFWNWWACPPARACDLEPALSAPQRHPLTVDEIIRITDEIPIDKKGFVIDIVRAVEQAHGIGGEA
jgi:hypothetical protein